MVSSGTKAAEVEKPLYGFSTWKLIGCLGCSCRVGGKGEKMKKLLLTAAVVAALIWAAASATKKEGSALSAAYYGKQQKELKAAGIVNF